MKKIIGAAMLAVLLSGCAERDQAACPPWSTLGKVERVYSYRSGKSTSHGVLVSYTGRDGKEFCKTENFSDWAWDYFQVGDTVRTLNFDRAVRAGRPRDITEDLSGAEDKPR